MVLRTIKRLVIVGGLVGALLYVGDACSINRNVIDPVFNNKPIQEGYPNPRDLNIEKRVNDAGKLEGYLVYSEGEQKQELPILRNGSGLQVGENDYWWGILTDKVRNSFVVDGWTSLDVAEKTRIVSDEFSKLADYARNKLAVEGWELLSTEKKGELVTDEFSKLSGYVKDKLAVEGWQQLNTEKKEELVTQDWDLLGKDTKYPLVKGELEKALDAFYEQNNKQNIGGEQDGFDQDWF